LKEVTVSSVVIAGIVQFPFLLLWLFLLSRVDARAREKGTWRPILWMLLAGGVSVFPATFAYEINPFSYGPWLGEFMFNFTVVGITEEFVKFLTFVVMARVLRSIREPKDGIIQGAAVGIGFSIIENLLYAVWYGAPVMVARIIAPGIHAIAGAFWGFAWAGAVYENIEERRPSFFRHAVVAVICVAVLHGLYNTIAVFIYDFNIAMSALWLFDLLLLIGVFAVYRFMHARSPYYRFPYSDADTAVAVIHRALVRMPGNPVLRRRLAVYCIAAGLYHDAASHFREFAKRSPDNPVYAGFLGVALTGAGNEVRGRELLAECAARMSPARFAAFERELHRIVQDPVLEARLDGILRSPAAALDAWASRREYLRQWNAPRVVHRRLAGDGR
jgi:RsiW-degrading membrane proteinase PrsW (M82 family)